MEKCMHPLLEERESSLILDKIQSKMKESGFQFLVLQEAHNIFYATGYFPVIPSAIAVVPVEGNPTLIISTLESKDAECITNNIEVRSVMSWVFIDDGTPESYRDKGDMINANDSINIVTEIINKKELYGKIGVEGGISHRLYKALADKFPEEVMGDCTKSLTEARIRKTPWEIKMIRIAAKHLERTYDAVAHEIKPGMAEYMIHNLFVKYSAEFDTEGTLGRCSRFIPAVGPYYGLCGLPRGYVLKEGDIVKFDVGFTHFGFQSDIARTIAVGGVATDDAIELYDTLYKANRLGAAMLKPGVKCSDIYQAVRDEVEKSTILPKYPRGHVGHSIGCTESAEEYPQLSKVNDIVIEKDMTFSLETPYSGTGNAVVIGGFNIEDSYVILEDGHEAFTVAPDNIFWR